jgi:hypothetical protein
MPSRCRRRSSVASRPPRRRRRRAGGGDAQAAATRVERAHRAIVGQRVAAWYPQARAVPSMVAEVPGTVTLPNDPHALDSLDLLVCEGVVGVAESGAIWIADSRLGARAALVLASDVVVLLRETAIVSDLRATCARPARDLHATCTRSTPPSMWRKNRSASSWPGHPRPPTSSNRW